MIATQKNHNGYARYGTRSYEARYIGHTLDVVGLAHLEEGGDVGDGSHTGRMNQLRRAVTCGLKFHNGGEQGSRLFDVGRVTACRAACDQILARVGITHELLRLRAAHGAGICLDGYKFESAARKNLAIDRIVQIEALVQAGFIDVEGVTVLHGELAHAQQA